MTALANDSVLTIWICVVVLGLVNFPFVWLVNRHVNSRPVKRVYAIDASPEQERRERRNAWVTTPIHAVLFGAFVFGGVLRVQETGWQAFVGTFLLALVWTEVWHYASHRAMHWKPLHFIHVEHHRSRVTQPWTSVSFSLLEKFIFSAGILGGLAIASQWQPLSAMGITCYYVVYFFTNTLGHANFEFRAPSYRRTWMGRIFNSPTYHALHHARYIRNYGLLTPWLDQLFGTEWDDADAVQTQVAQGRPLQRLQDRARPGAA